MVQYSFMHAIIDFISNHNFLPIVICNLVAILIAAMSMLLSLRNKNQKAVPLLWATLTILLVFSNWAMLIWFNAVQVDRSLHDTYYIIADYRYLISITLLPLVFTLFYTFFTKIRRRNYRLILAGLHWGTFTMGSGLLAYPMFQTFLTTMSKRYIDFHETSASNNLISTIGSVILLASFIFFIAVLIFTRPIETGNKSLSTE